MANFCNKCGSPVSGVFCNKCGAATSATANATRPPGVTPPSLPAPTARFCNSCGTPVTAPFCPKCGAVTRAAASPMPPPVTPPAGGVSTMPAQLSSAPAKGSPLVKILVGFLVVVIVFGALAAGGVYYVVYRVKKKVHEVAAEIPGGGSIFNSDSNSGSSSRSGSSGGRSDGGGSNAGISGDVCRFLSKDEAGRAIGVEILATQTADSGCSYLAKGDTGGMTAKHMSAMMGAKGADAKTQQMIQGITGGMFKAMQSDNHEATSDANGNVPVFMFSIDTNSADTQMQLNQKVLGGLGPGQQEIQNIGDQAFDEAGAMMMVRKGDKLIRIMYSTCPCSVENIKPLAKKLADRL
jgi:hypothetical protein